MPPRSRTWHGMPRPSASARRSTGIDPDGVRAYREGIVAKKYKGLEGLVKARGITVVPGEGVLEAGPAVRVGDDLYRGTDVVLATGSYSRSLPGLEIGGRILTSEHALELAEIPQRVVILGGGVIGVEFASVWRSFGADVTIVEALDHLVPNEDVAMSKALERAFRKRGIAYSLGVRFAGATQTADAVTVTLENGTDVRGGLPPRRRRPRPGRRQGSDTRRTASRSIAAS